MFRKAEPPPSTLVFSAVVWAPLHEAFALAEGALGSSLLAEGDLTRHLRSGRLPLAIYRGGTLERVEPTFLKSLRAGEADPRTGHRSILVSGLPDEITSSTLFFVARAPLNKLYSTDPTPSGAPEAPDAPPRRKPAPKHPRLPVGKRKSGAKERKEWAKIVPYLKSKFPRKPPESDVSFNVVKDWLASNKTTMADSTIRDGLRRHFPKWPRDSRRR
jgi:hypothetical protein